MPKNIDDMIVPERKRSIRNIPLPDSRKHIDRVPGPTPVTAPVPVIKEGDTESPVMIPPFMPKDRQPLRGGNGKKGKVWLAAGVITLALIFAALSFWNAGTFSYLPKSAALSFEDEVYKAYKTASDGLPYSVVKLSREKGMEALASGEQEASLKASGVIIVYNDASTEPQKLIATTRFENRDGLVYRIAEDITVPGKKVVGGTELPGSIEVTVYADTPGKEYNIGLTDFTLPGLAGTPRFTTVYARSKTAMSGGFVGKEFTVGTEEKAQVKTALETALKNDLISEVAGQVPDGFVLFPSLSSMTFEDLPQTTSNNESKAIVNMRGNLAAVMFKRSDLSLYLALDKVKLNAGESVDIIGLDSLAASFSGTSTADLLSSDTITFSVAGAATAIWHTDEVALKTDLIGKRKKDIASVLNNYPSIVSATSTIRPFWKSSYPSNGAYIYIKQLPVK